MDILEKFPTCKQEPGCSWLNNVPAYDEIVAAFGHEVLVTVADNDYQGDTRYLLRSGARYGHLNVGWGSCSGCDALQACSTLEELQKLADEIEQSIQWFESQEEACQWFETHDWKGDYYWYQEEQAQYVDRVLRVLGSRCKVVRGEEGYEVR